MVNVALSAGNTGMVNIYYIYTMRLGLRPNQIQHTISSQLFFNRGAKERYMLQTLTIAHTNRTPHAFELVYAHMQTITQIYVARNEPWPRWLIYGDIYYVRKSYIVNKKKIPLYLFSNRI